MTSLFSLLLLAGCAVGYSAPIGGPLLLILLLVSEGVRVRLLRFTDAAPGLIGLGTSFALVVGAEMAGTGYTSLPADVVIPTQWLTLTLTLAAMGLLLGATGYRAYPARPLPTVGLATLQGFTVGYIALGVPFALVISLQDTAFDSFAAAILLANLYYLPFGLLVPTVTISLAVWLRRRFAVMDSGGEGV